MAKKCETDVSILARPLSETEPLIKNPARSETSGPHFVLDSYILVILNSKQFATFLHISLKKASQTSH